MEKVLCVQSSITEIMDFLVTGPDGVHLQDDDPAVVLATEDDRRGDLDGAHSLPEGGHHLDDEVCRHDDAVLEGLEQGGQQNEAPAGGERNLGQSMW